MPIARSFHRLIVAELSRLPPASFGCIHIRSISSPANADIVAVAPLAAIAILLASGKAEAKAGPGDEDLLGQLFQALTQKGISVPPDVQRTIESDPAQA